MIIMIKEDINKTNKINPGVNKLFSVSIFLFIITLFFFRKI